MSRAENLCTVNIKKGIGQTLFPRLTHSGFGTQSLLVSTCCCFSQKPESITPCGCGRRLSACPPLVIRLLPRASISSPLVAFPSVRLRV
jgi:hypothetical protein